MLATLRAVAATTPPQSAAVHCDLGGTAYRLEAWGDDSVRVRVGAAPAAEGKQQALLPQTPKPARTVTAAPMCSVTSGNLVAALKDGKLVFTDAKGSPLLQEIGREVCSGAACDATLPPPASISFASSPDERLYGLGEHLTGSLDNHGQLFDFMDAGVYDHHHGSDIVLPFYLSSKKLGFLWNKASFGSFASTDEQITWTSASTSLLDFWVTTGSGAKPASNPFKQILTNFADATGHPPRMPEFATCGTPLLPRSRLGFA